jgi:hypothetical protein
VLVLVLELGTHLDDENEHDDEHDSVAAAPHYDKAPALSLLPERFADVLPCCRVAGIITPPGEEQGESGSCG